jgi:hypothetical protein
MKESKDRTEQFMSSATSAASQAPSSELTCRSANGTTDVRLGSLLLGGGRPRPTDQNGAAAGAPRFPDPKGKSRAPQDGDILALDLVTAEEGTASEGGGGAFMQMQLVEQQVGAASMPLPAPLTQLSYRRVTSSPEQTPSSLSKARLPSSVKSSRSSRRWLPNRARLYSASTQT